MPGGNHLPGASPKRQRQYEAIKKATGSKAIAAATVNKQRREAGETKRQPRR